MTKTNKRFTLATLKSILKTKTCYVKTKSRFDGMTDGVEPVDGNWSLVDKSKLNFEDKHTFGTELFYLVGNSRDYFKVTELDDCTNVYVYNSCGSFDIKVTRSPNTVNTLRKLIDN